MLPLGTLQAIACSAGSDVSGHPCVAALHALRLLACGVVAVASSAEAAGPVDSDSEALMQDVFSTVFECLKAGHQAFLGREAVKPKAKPAVSEQVCVVLCCVCGRVGGGGDMLRLACMEILWRCFDVVLAWVSAELVGSCTCVSVAISLSP